LFGHLPQALPSEPDENAKRAASHQNVRPNSSQDHHLAEQGVAVTFGDLA
jgi:hypothetical protein